MLRLPGTPTRSSAGRSPSTTRCSTSRHAVGIDVVYLVVGKMTGLLAEVKAGDPLEVWGPLGNGFPDLIGDEHVVWSPAASGRRRSWPTPASCSATRGYGGERRATRVRTRVALLRRAHGGPGGGRRGLPRRRLRRASGQRRRQLGFKGFVTQLLAKRSARAAHSSAAARSRCCTPWRSSTATGARRAIVSLETPMACGVGICFSCVTKVKTPTGWDYKRVCVDGPVFEARSLEM